MSAVRVAITGAAGRMGQRLVALAHKGEGTVVAGAAEHSAHGQIGHDAGMVAGIGPIDVTISPGLSHDIGRADVVIDFSTPEATVEHAAVAGEANVPIVIGTTGMSKAQIAEVEKSLSNLPYVMAPNMSVGVNLILRLLEIAGHALDDDYDVEIAEIHHRYKVDAPSGTALRMAEVVAAARGVDLNEAGVFSRHGDVGPRKRGSIGVQTLRAGDVAGEHTVIFGADAERVEIVHKASSRDPFAQGAIRAARWVVGKKPGPYHMWDVLGLG